MKSATQFAEGFAGCAEPDVPHAPPKDASGLDPPPQQRHPQVSGMTIPTIALKPIPTGAEIVVPAAIVA
jgi:hypothetical protein